MFEERRHASVCDVAGFRIAHFAAICVLNACAKQFQVSRLIVSLLVQTLVSWTPLNIMAAVAQFPSLNDFVRGFDESRKDDKA